MNGPSFFTFNPAMSQLGQRQFQSAPQTFYGQSMQQEQLGVRRDIDEAIRYNRPLSDQLWQYGQDVGAISRPFIATGGGKSGSYGGFGRGRDEQPVPTPNLSAVLANGQQPSQRASVPPIVPDRSLGMTAENPLAFTGFGRATGESAYRTPTIPQTVPSPIPVGTTRTMTSFGGIPRFPFSGY